MGRAGPRPPGTASPRQGSPPSRRPSAAEAGLLDLARSLAATGAESGDGEALGRALIALEEAFGPRSPLPRQLAHAWLRARDDKSAVLALGWAREQVRRALADAVMRAWPANRREADGPSPDSAAWLLLAVAEGESHEVGGTVGDRLHLVCDLLSLPRPVSAPAG